MQSRDGVGKRRNVPFPLGLWQTPPRRRCGAGLLLQWVTRCHYLRRPSDRSGQPRRSREPMWWPLVTFPAFAYAKLPDGVRWNAKILPNIGHGILGLLETLARIVQKFRGITPPARQARLSGLCELGFLRGFACRFSCRFSILRDFLPFWSLAAFFVVLRECRAVCVAHPRRAGARVRFAIAKLRIYGFGKWPAARAKTRTAPNLPRR